jgi:hypothetical protein
MIKHGEMTRGLLKELNDVNKLKDEKIVDLEDVRNLKLIEKDMLEQIDENSEFFFNTAKEVDPLYAAYMHAIRVFYNIFMAISEGSSFSNKFDTLIETIENLEEIYMPDGPPLSPLSMSYFSSWSYFDLSLDEERETLIDVVRAVLDNGNENPDKLFENLSESYTCFFVIIGIDGKIFQLREFFTNKEYDVFLPTNYKWQKGDIVYTRILPSPIKKVNYCSSIMTPYKVNGSIDEWMLFFKRHIKNKENANKEYYKFMKYGPSQNYWNEYIMDAYNGYNSDVIFLTGIPDLPKTLPHSLKK